MEKMSDYAPAYALLIVVASLAAASAGVWWVVWLVLR